MPQTSTQGESVLDSFTKGFNEAIHGCARTLFPATSTYSGGEPEARTGNRFESFAPVRNGNGVKWYVDGKDYMYAVSVALEKARESIWILDWWLSPELYLRRPPKLNEQYRLDRMLQAAAARGVHINVIVYKEVTQALTLDSHHTKHALEDLHQNICVFRHPDHLPDRDNVIRNTLTKIQSGNYQLGDGLKGIYGFKNDITLYFAHHEKLCLIDGEIAFMGGLDLCFGRFDTNDHPIADAHPSDLNAIIFPGQDYNNARFMDFQHVDKWQDNVVSRLELPRMGWSDVTMSLMGPGVKDLQKHFVQRWNFIYDEKYDARGVPRYSRLDASAFEGGHGYHRRHLKEKMKRTLRDPGHYGGYYEQQNQDYRSDQEPEGVRVQICRSVSRWSHRPPETEHSIANAYSKIISAADHFVYIENQFFITATDPAQKPILNTIGQAIVNRIIRAHNEAKRFRIIVVMPAVPAFAGDLQSDGALGTRAIMEFQYRSINRDRGYSIYEQLEKAGIDPKEYIRFYNLRSYDRINTAGAEAGKEATGVNYESAARAHDEAVGGGIGYGRQEGAGAYGAPIEGDEYKMYQSNAPKLGSGGQWDSVAKCVMLGGADIRQVPWDGDPDKEIDAFVSEELYVHSKLLIADDRLVLMGSANLNDRSQLGDHDSEIACIIEDPTELRSFMNGSPHIAAHFAATLRRQIFRKHLGLIPAQNFHTEDANMLPVPVPNIYDFDSPEDYLVRDPLSDKFWNFWNETAKVNTEVFSRVFHAVPHDSVTNWRIYEEYWSKYFAAPKGKKEGQGGAEPMIKWGHVVTPNFTPGAAGAREVKELLSAVRGHLVEMPLDFLKEEDIAKEGLGLNALTEILYT
ncbi:hypothetical protein FN846DRAFT_772614 [Sphaerosporella brunnea]|uniref:Phospholipase n=1 Tax=Sphaerosporella brunnea TaxID=1250544 RepID=A0A5J5F8D7_9PEZI|nr:hypothetical protein FN846DRAFT_772614 [Sphaerosporella brunnea]